VTEEHALYVRDGDAFVGTRCTGGPWQAGSQSGGAVLALLGHVLEDVPTLVPMSLTRLTADFVRPVPVGKPLLVSPQVIREGKKLQVVDLTVTAGDADCVRARALRVRDADLTALDGMPSSTTGDDPASRLPPADDLQRVDELPRVADFLRYGAEMRRTAEPVGGLHGVLLRLRVPVVAGEPVRATSRVALPMDFVNLIGLGLQTMRATAVNPDVSAHVLRPPLDGWVALIGDTRFGPEVGHGVSVATMSDASGVFGITSTSQIVQPVGEGTRALQ
jgi:hypothetical protein